MESHGMDLDMLGSAVASSGMTVSERFVSERKFFIVQYSIGTLIRLFWFICKKKLSHWITQPLCNRPANLDIIWPSTWSYMQNMLYWIVLFARGWTIQMIQIIYANNCGTQPSSLQYINRLDFSYDQYCMKVICSNGRSSLKGPDYQSNPNKLPYYFILFATSFTIQMIRIRCNQLSCRTVFFATDLTILLIQIIICKK